MRVKQSEKGFTIIEVVLVLAIAGLIFMMVFIALPALQRSQRDSQRKNDLSRAITAIANYSSSNRGSLPIDSTAWNGSFMTQYLTTANDTFIDPAGANTTNKSATTYLFLNEDDKSLANASFSDSAKGTDAATQNVIYYSVGYTCDTDGAVKAAGTRKVALRMVLEGGGVVCQNN